MLRLQTESFEIRNIALDLVLRDGILAADHLQLHTIGGDIKGGLTAQLSKQGAFRLKLDLLFAGIDASVLTDIPPGPESEINGDAKLSFEQTELTRDINGEVNVTKIGATTFDRFLQALDPKQEQESIQDARDKLWMIDIDRLALWIKYENLKMYLHYSTFIGIPGTSLAFRPIPQEFPRQNLTVQLDESIKPLLMNSMGPYLGWKTIVANGAKQ